MISASIITKNEEVNIAECLELLSWVDEIVVLDSGSSDRTVEIARHYTDKVFVEEWRGQGAQKNRALELAKGPWIISIDADERVPPELAGEMREAIISPRLNAYAVRRKNIYRGRWIRHGGWWPDWVTRLFKKGEAYFNDRVIHDSLQVQGAMGRLSHPLIHYSFRSAEDFLTRAHWYAIHQATEMYNEGKEASLWTAISHAAFSLGQAYFLRWGFLDGAPGTLIAVSNAVGVFYRYMMLRELSMGVGNPDEERG